MFKLPFQFFNWHIYISLRYLYFLQLFDNAMNMIKNGYWCNSVFNGSEVRVDSRSCLENEYPYCDYDDVNKVEYFLWFPFCYCFILRALNAAYSPILMKYRLSILPEFEIEFVYIYYLIFINLKIHSII